jgi:hypothetical protein
MSGDLLCFDFPNLRKMQNRRFFKNDSMTQRIRSCEELTGDNDGDKLGVLETVKEARMMIMMTVLRC